MVIADHVRLTMVQTMDIPKPKEQQLCGIRHWWPTSIKQWQPACHKELGCENQSPSLTGAGEALSKGVQTLLSSYVSFHTTTPRQKLRSLLPPNIPCFLVYTTHDEADECFGNLEIE